MKVVSQVYIEKVFLIDNLNMKGGEKEMIKKGSVFLIILILGVSFVSAINLIKPMDGEIYSEKRVLMDLEAYGESNFYFKEDTYGIRGWTRLCKRTTHCQRKMTFDDGMHTISFKAVNSDGESEFIENISFEVDANMPRILSMLPTRNTLINGSRIDVKYTEDNLQELILFYGKPGNIKNITKTDCESGKSMWCVFENLDVAEFEGDEINYWFEISDKVSTILSRERVVKVDVTPPEVKHFSYDIRGRRVNFIFEVKEDNFGKITYIDRSELRPRWKRLCASLRDGSCNKVEGFRPGVHELDIMMTDNAGNSVMIVEGEMVSI